MAGVSTATVSRVLNGNYPVAAATRERVARAVSKLGYAANANARSLTQSGTGVIGVVVPEIVDPFFGYLIRGLEQAAAEADRLLIVSTTSSDPDREMAIIDRMREHRVDSVIVVSGALDDPTYRRRLALCAESLDRMGSRLVLCAHPPLDPPTASRTVTYDNEGGAFAITTHLIDMGHRRIAFVGGTAEIVTMTRRLDGYRRALRTRGVDVDEALIRLDGFGRRTGYDATRALVESGVDVTAVLAVNDTIAAGVYEAAADLALSVPADLSVAAYDDTPLAQDLVPKLTTVHVPLEQLGREALRAALADQDAFSRTPEDVVTLGTHLVHRDSVAPPRMRS